MFIFGLLQGLKDIAISKRLYTAIGCIVLWIMIGMYMLMYLKGAISIAALGIFVIVPLIAVLLVLTVIAELKKKNSTFNNLADQYSIKDIDDLKSVSMIIRSGETLLATLNDLLDFVSIQTGELSFLSSTFNLEDTINMVILRNESHVKQKKIGIKYTIDEDIPESIYGDPARLTQILQNLTSNAIKFTEMGGVLISARLMADHDDHVIIEFRVQDTGIGIEEGMQEMIFNPFEQGSSDMKRKFGGTGIGLSIVKHLVAIQDGEIEMKSQLGEGSEFYFSLSFLKSHVAEHIEVFEIRNMKSDKKDIPIIAMTAHSIKGEQEKCLSIGMNDFISKPFQAKELYEKVRKLVAANRNVMLK